MRRKIILLLGALPISLCAGPAIAQTPVDPDPNVEIAGPNPEPASPFAEPVDLTEDELAPLESPVNADEVAFSAQTLAYDNGADTVTASGDVRMVRNGVRLRADRVVWNRSTGEVRAFGDVAVASPEGDTAYADGAQLTDTLRDAVVENLLIVLENGGRLVARHATRVDGVSTLEDAAYTPYRPYDAMGEPRDPSWQIDAVRVIHNPDTHRIYYRNARFVLFGIPIIALPSFSHPDGSQGGSSGFLVPDLSLSRSNGLEIALPYYWKIAQNRDLTISPHVYTDVLPMLEARYRNLAAEGAFQVAGYATYGRRRPINPLPGTIDDGNEDIRGYLEANGRFQFTPYWSLSGSGRIATDDTFLRRYDITRDDRLRSTIEGERIGEKSYFSVAGWAVQDLRQTADAGQQPIALPAIDWRLRMDDPLLGGRISFQANSLGILRTDGQDTQRAFVGAEWDLRRITALGQELTLTALVRGDAYHSDENFDTLTTLYSGDPGWQFRGIGAVAADMRWPFVGELLGGTQQITPHVQIVATPSLVNLDLPNEDSRSIELEDSNIFSLNRFPGYDRFEDGARVTYGVEYALDVPRFQMRSSIGQSYRLTDEPQLFPDGVGLTNNLSDIVGRTDLRYGRFVALTHRFRLDKDNLKIRRNEIDFAIGSNTTYAEIGYLRLDRDVAFTIEDLRDREEARAGARVALTDYWSIFGSAVVDLTSQQEDPLSQSDGFDPVRTRLGFAYIDEGLEFGFTWRRDYDDTGDARRGNTFLLRLAFRNLGR